MPFYALPYHIGVWKGMAGHKKGNGYKLEEGPLVNGGQEKNHTFSMDIAREICTDSFYTVNSGTPRIPVFSCDTRLFDTRHFDT